MNKLIKKIKNWDIERFLANKLVNKSMNLFNKPMDVETILINDIMMLFNVSMLLLFILIGSPFESVQANMILAGIESLFLGILILAHSACASGKISGQDIFLLYFGVVATIIGTYVSVFGGIITLLFFALDRMINHSELEGRLVWTYVTFACLFGFICMFEIQNALMLIIK